MNLYRCSCCYRDLPVSEYRPARHIKRGFQYYCNDCEYLTRTYDDSLCSAIKVHLRDFGFPSHIAIRESWKWSD